MCAKLVDRLLQQAPPQDLGKVLVVTCCYRAVEVTIWHSETVLHGAPPDKILYCIWDDNSPAPDSNRLLRYCRLRGIRYVRAEKVGVEGHGHLSTGMTQLRRRFVRYTDGHIFVTESDCILPINWYGRYCRLAGIAPPGWGALCGLAVNSQDRVTYPDRKYLRDTKIAPTSPYFELPRIAVSGALLRRDMVQEGIYPKPGWRLMMTNVHYRQMINKSKWRIVYDPSIRIYHLGRASRNKLRRDLDEGVVQMQDQRGL